MDRPKTIKRSGIAAGVVAIIAPLVMFYEGKSLKPYLDPVGIATVCYGETNVAMREYSESECADMLGKSLKHHGDEMLACLPGGIPDPILAASLSLAYNVGVSKFCGSTLARYLREHRYAEACNEFPRWNKAGGKVLNGLVKRRAAEREVCLTGVMR